MSAIARGGVAAQAAVEGKAGVVWASVRVLQASASVGKAEHMKRLGHGKHERVEKEVAAKAAVAAVAAVKGERGGGTKGRECNGHKKRLRMGVAAAPYSVLDAAATG
jgi:hypothetical protein